MDRFYLSIFREPGLRELLLPKYIIFKLSNPAANKQKLKQKKKILHVLLSEQRSKYRLTQKEYNLK